ncbi:hypothetical protein, partial [Parabacteroides sp. D26]|uniref:hypothetical protein n=2 Tax=Parabacteroides sp. D26 TaxID=658662 RepID=UPI0035A3AAFD
VNGYGGRQTKENEKSWCFKGWETLVNNVLPEGRIHTSGLLCYSTAILIGLNELKSALKCQRSVMKCI